MASRELNDWLAAYIHYTKNTEPPRSFHTWTGLSLLAGALQRRVYLKWGHDTIYPNLYVVLIGPSGRARKGTAMNIGKDILREVGIKLTSDSITREALIRDMKEAVTTFVDSTTGDTRFHCSITAFSPELSVFLGQKDVKFLADLTDWYDCADAWTYRTKHQGEDRIAGVCFNLLGGTAADWLQSILPQEAIGGGFTSRIIFIVEDNKGQSVPEPIMTADDIRLRKALIRDLERIATISGQMKMSPDCTQAYVEWYEGLEADIERGKPPIEDPRFAGFVDRLSTHIRKVSILMSASRSNDLIIEAEDFDRAVDLMNRTMPKMPKTFGGLGMSPYSEITERILNFIERRKKTTQAELMQRFYRDVDSQTLKLIEEAMRQMKVVKVSMDPQAKEIYYEWVGK